MLEKDLGCPEATNELPGRAGSAQRRPRKDGRKGTLSSLQAGSQEVLAVAVPVLLPWCLRPCRRGLSLAEMALCGAGKSRGNLGRRGVPTRRRPRGGVSRGQGEEEQRLVPSSVFLTLIFAQKKCE